MGEGVTDSDKHSGLINYRIMSVKRFIVQAQGEGLEGKMERK